MQSRSSWRVLLVCAGVALAACGPPHQPPPSGTLTITFAPQPPAVANLTLTAASVIVDRVQPIGNVPPPGPPPAPMDLPIDVLSPTGTSLEFERLPQGIYSRVQLTVDGVMMMGSWRGTPFSALIGPFGANPVDLRSNVGHEIGPDENATMTVSVNVASWFAGNILDQAMVSNGQILCDAQNNPMVTGMLSLQVDGSFTLQ